MHKNSNKVQEYSYIALKPVLGVTSHSPSAVITCPTPGVIVNPDNGQVSVGEVTFDSVATYSCDDGFTLKGTATRTCTSDGTWSGDNPTCGEYLCSTRQPIFHMAIGSSQSTHSISW